VEIARLCGYVKKRRRGSKTAVILEVDNKTYVLSHRVDSGILDSVVGLKITAEGVLRDNELTIYTHATHRT
jgi:hypothetical protein